MLEAAAGAVVKLVGPAVGRQMLAWAKGSEARQLVKLLKKSFPAAEEMLTQPEALRELWLYAQTGNFDREATVQAVRPLVDSDEEAEAMAEAIRTNQWRVMRDELQAHFEFQRLEHELRAEMRAGTAEVLARIEQAREELAAKLPAARQLPAQTAPFADRVEQLASAQQLLGARRPLHAAAVLNFCGMVGTGKSALALELAYGLQGQFDGGILYVDMRRRDGSRRSEAEVAARLLRDLGVAPEAIPADGEERIIRLRSILAHDPVLLVLDNATDEDDIASLIPPLRESTVLVTSRAPLFALPAAELIELDQMDDGDAREVLVAIAGEGRFEEGPALEAILEHCEGLPMALAVIAGLARRQPWLTSEELAARCAEGELVDALAAAIAAAPEEARRLLLLLAALDATEIDPELAAAVGGRDAAGALEELAVSRLLLPTAGGRWRIHRLIREVAAGLAEKELGKEAIEEAQRRRVNWLVSVNRKRAADLDGGA